jgi:hypothetical protein
MREETPAGWTDEMSRRLPRFEGQEVLSTTTAG